MKRTYYIFTLAVAVVAAGLGYQQHANSVLRSRAADAAVQQSIADANLRLTESKAKAACMKLKLAYVERGASDAAIKVKLAGQGMDENCEAR